MPETTPDMADFVLKALEYGVLGLCAITLILVASIIRAEQKRDDFPRKGILQASYVFMAFCVALAFINGYVQLQERPDTEQTARIKIDLAVARSKLVVAESQQQFIKSELTKAKGKLNVAENKLLAIRSAARPILSTRANIVGRLPPGPTRDDLFHLIEELSKALR